MRRLLRRSLPLAVLAALSMSLSAVLPAGAQEVKPPDRLLTVSGDVAAPLRLTLADIKAMSRTTVTVSEGGKDVKYEGVRISDILKRAGVPLGEEMHGDAAAAYVVAGARDGYRTVFSIAELDPGFTSNDIIVADAVDGRPLDDHQGPLKIAAPHDKRAARAVRMLDTLTVVRPNK